MNYLVLSICCSVTVGVLFKLARRYQINITQAVTWNYLFALCLSFFFFKPDFSSIQAPNLSLIHLALGLLMPSIFIIMAFSIRHAGLARTDIAQRLSLFISICAAYFLFKEQFDRYKEVALVFGFAAILLIVYRRNESPSNKWSWLYLSLVFLGFGTVDILFKMVSQMQAINYTTSLFVIYGIAFFISLLYLGYQVLKKDTKLQAVNLLCGFILGFFNFGNILFYLKAHQAMASNPSTVFAAMNLGVILLGSLIGVAVFKEKLSQWNYLGLFCAVIAIVLITLSKIYAI